MNAEPTNTEPMAEPTAGKPAEAPAEAAGTTQAADGTEMELKEDIVVTENEKAYAKALRRIFGIGDDEELGDVSRRAEEFEKQSARAAEQTRNAIITASLKALGGYDTKLLGKVIDLSDVKVDENGTVTGLEAAVKAAEKEYPAVKLPQEKKEPFVPIRSGAGAEGRPTMNDIIRGKR